MDDLPPPGLGNQHHHQGGGLHPSTLSNISKFSGGKSEESYEWLNHIDDLGALFNWSDNQKLSVARVRLTGTAHQWVRGLPATVTTWDRFKASFLGRFGEKYETLLGKLHQIHQQEGETVKSYCDHFSTLIAQPGHSIEEYGHDADTNPMFRTYFLQGLRTYLRTQVLTQKPANLSSAMEAARYFDDATWGNTSSPGYERRTNDRRPPQNYNGPPPPRRPAEGYNDRRPPPRWPPSADRQPLAPQQPAGNPGNAGVVPPAAPIKSNDPVDELRRQVENLKLMYDGQAGYHLLPGQKE